MQVIKYSVKEARGWAFHVISPLMEFPSLKEPEKKNKAVEWREGFMQASEADSLRFPAKL